MQSAIELRRARWQTTSISRRESRTISFAVALVVCALASALLASWLPLQLSLVTVFLFAGPHNWFELRYFLMRLPVRFGRSRNFFLTAFAGIGFLSATYASLPFVFTSTSWSEQSLLAILATWNTLLLLWLAVLVGLRGKQKTGKNWSWAFPLAFGVAGINWLAPELFSLTVVYLHPLIALWFLDRHLARTRPAWLTTYRRCLVLVPMLLALMIWRLSYTRSLADDNGLFWRITQHSGAGLLPGVPNHLLVSVHVFLETLHYGVWLVALPLIAPIALGANGVGPGTRRTSQLRIWDPKTIPVARHPRGFPKTTAVLLLFALFAVVVLWIGFMVDYSTTRDIYFTVAIAHVLAEAPFLLKSL